MNELFDGLTVLRKGVGPMELIDLRPSPFGDCISNGNCPG